VGMLSTLEVETNLKALDFEMSPALLKEIDRMVAPVKDLTWPSGKPENSDA